MQEVQVMKWYELNEEDKIKNVYSKYKIKDFWDWWSNGEQKVMEVRIKDFALIKQVANKYELPYSASGVYVWNDILLKNVIAIIRDKATVWFGINPRKRNWNKYGKKSFGGTDYNISEINYIFIDIDRVDTSKPAEKEELKNCDDLANKILERLGTQGWNKNYIKICSGHGVQLLIKLDIPIKLPVVNFDNKDKIYENNEEFNNVKRLLTDGIGKQIKKFTNKFRDELQANMDSSAFFIGKVGALPCTKNVKFGTQRWRGIVEMLNGDNVGLTDYILSFSENQPKIKDLFIKSRANFKEDVVTTVKQLEEHPVVQFMINNKLPGGMRNNYIWFSIKILIRDGKIDITSNEFKNLHKKLEESYGGHLTLNLPEKRFVFSKDIINSFCLNNFIKPIYPLWPEKNKKLNMMLEGRAWEFKDDYDVQINLKGETDIFEDMKEFSKILEEGHSSPNMENYYGFVNACIKKYGEEKTKYYFDNGVFYKFFSYK